MNLKVSDTMTINDVLCSDDVVESINNNLDYILNVIPEIRYMIGFEHKNPHHHLDVWNHTLLALSLSDNDFDIRLTLLLHDIGKPFCYQEYNNIRYFKDHPIKSADMAYAILKRLNYSNEYIEKICFYVRNHDYPITNKLICSNREDAIKMYKIQKCDVLAHHPEKLEKRKEYLKRINNKLQFID